jgi:translocation protein SEC66
MISLFVPLAYFTILIGSFFSFSYFYRNRRIRQAVETRPWFDSHLSRDIYLSLLHKENPSCPSLVLNAALLRRACESVSQLISVKQSKQALHGLLQRGQVGEELWKQCEVAEREADAELVDIVSEAEALQKEWGKVILPNAQEMMWNHELKQKIELVNAQLLKDKAWWEWQGRKEEKPLRNGIV